MTLKDAFNRISHSYRALLVLFLITLPLVNPWVRGDGVGYYAYVRATLIEGRLDFEKDWQHGNTSFLMSNVRADGKVNANQYTLTGHIANQWTVGPSLLWTPFLAFTHVAVLFLDRMGAHLPADGFSPPYLVTMAVATALYGFLGLCFSFCLARKYFEERWAFLATIGIWLASSLPVYMYFNPSWSHAHSAFVVSLFLWYWHRTRATRTLGQWIFLGLLSGLAVDVYYPNGCLLVIPLLEAVGVYWGEWNSHAHGGMAIPKLLLTHAVYLGALVAGLLPTLISRYIIYGSPINLGGYPSPQSWPWEAPAIWSVLFSSDHGLLSWTPILMFALIGLVLFLRVDRTFALYLIVAFVFFWAVISLHPSWDGLSSFGNRFFVSLTPLFVLGLAAFFDWLARVWRQPHEVAFAFGATALLIVWNLGLIFQWGVHLIPARGHVSWRQTAYNQFTAVPATLVYKVELYFLHRHALMNDIEKSDVKQLEKASPAKN